MITSSDIKISDSRKATFFAQQSSMFNRPMYATQDTGKFSDLEVSTTYHNGTNKNVTLVTRENIKMLIEPEMGNVTVPVNVNWDILRESMVNKFSYENELQGKFVVRKRFGFKAIKLPSIIKTMRSQPNGSSVVNKLIEILSQLEQSYRTDMNFTNQTDHLCYVTMDLTVDERSFMDTEAFYFTEGDVLLTNVDPSEAESHPSFTYTNDSKPREFYSDNFDNDHEYTISFVSNSVDREFFYLQNGEVQKIISKKLPNRHDGFYFKKTIIKNGRRLKRFERFCTIEDAPEKLRIYDTKEKAIAYGDTKENRYIEFEREKHEYEKELLKLKIDHDSKIKELKEEYEKNKLEMAKLLDESKLRVEERKEKTEEVKDYYESRSYERKDTSETLKVLPTIITGVAGIAVGIAGVTAVAGASSLVTMGLAAMAMGKPLIVGLVGAGAVLGGIGSTILSTAWNAVKSVGSFVGSIASSIGNFIGGLFS